MDDSLLDRLPNELIDLVAGELSTHDLCSLVLTAKDLSVLYNDKLLRKGMNEGGAPIRWAAYHGDVALVTKILDMDEQRSTRVAVRWTASYEVALLKAANCGEASTIRVLLQRLPGLDPDAVAAKHGRSPLWLAGLGGHVDALRVLIESGRVDRDRTDDFGRTALRMALECHHPDAVRTLLVLGADPRIADADGVTPAVAAAKAGYAGILRVLAAHDHGLVLEASGRNMITPLLAATKRGRVDAVRALLKLHVNPRVADADGVTPAVAAAKAGHADILGILAAHDHGLVLEGSGRNMTTPMLAATKRGRVDAVRALLKLGADPRVAGLDSSTPAIYAARRGHVAVLETLADYDGSLLQDVDANGQTLLQIAKGQAQFHVVRALLARSMGMTANSKQISLRLECAVIEHSQEVLQSLQADFWRQGWRPPVR